MDKRYRIGSPLDGMESKSTLTDRICSENPHDKPEHPSCHEGEWVCEHGLCPVRAVRLRVKALFYRHLPRLRCPLCLRTLVFRHWLNVVALSEVSAERKGNPSVAPPATKRGVRARKRKAAL